METKVVIVGAGMAGLGAAKTLHENGFDNFIILEAQGKIGGRVDAQSFGNSIVEMGAQWLHRDDSSLFRWVKSNQQIDDVLSWEAQGQFLTSTGEKVDDEKCKQFAEFFESKLQMDMEFVEEILNKPGVSNESNESIGDYLENIFDEYLKSNLGNDMSFDLKYALYQWMNSFQRIDNSCNKMTDVSLRRQPQCEKYFPNLIWHYYNFKQGTQKTFEKISKSFLPPEKLRLNCPVTRINWTGENEIIVQTTQEEFKCLAVIVTCSLGVLQEEKERLFHPSLPSKVNSAIDSSGPLGKIYLEWETPFWDADFKGYQFLWPNESIDSCRGLYDQKIFEENWVKAITGFDPVLNNPNVLLGWMGGPGVIYVETLDEEVIKIKCAQVLSRFLGTKVPQPKFVLVSKWNSNPYVRGAYSYCSVKSDHMKEVGDPWDTLSEPILKRDDLGLMKPAIVFAGEGTSKNYNSTLHGAFDSGEVQAKKLFAQLNKWREAREKITRVD